ncbi:sensory rhodopsin transducer [Cohnella ginsengisoli]|uniref:Sensory rhodopsin transducer n=1 Tax=Cohnella ginsengisoli TaxID=425004 RepID=A0A9X4KDM9_9BACL|nr:sensory rhodopsin transducer [Cohnella ginsengisoli]MDG0790077.1 sensory rhodopsin transducer [Cohnella ginsengisoli]
MSGQGAKNWYIVDGYLPYKGKAEEALFEGHEAVMILNCQSEDAVVRMDIFYEDREPDRDILIPVKAERVRCIRMDRADDIGGIVLDRQLQYSLRFRSDKNVIIQYGRMDIAQPNLAYIGMMGYSE